MKRVLLLAATMAVILPFVAHAQAKPDFSGTWTLDTAKSDPAPAGRGGGGGGAATLTIKQTGTELSIMSEGRQGPQTMTYKLDGSESTNQMMGRGGAAAVKPSAAKSQGGKEMQVETTAQTPNGEQKRKVVYTKS